MIITAILVILWVMLVSAALDTEQDTTCPKCGADTMEQGYEGIRRKCSKCDWSNNAR